MIDRLSTYWMEVAWTNFTDRYEDEITIGEPWVGKSQRFDLYDSPVVIEQIEINRSRPPALLFRSISPQISFN